MASSKVILITGANTGIGYETVKALLRSEQRYEILLGARDMEKAKQAAKDAQAEIASSSSIEPIQIDVESDESIQQAFDTVAAHHSRLDCLVNNAGASFDQAAAKGEMGVRAAWNRGWDVNVTGAHMTTATFVPLLLQSADPRLIFVTSGGSSLAQAADLSSPRRPPPPAGLPKPPAAALGYRASKAALNFVMLEWARTLHHDGVKVWAVAPGLLATNLGGDPNVTRQLGAQDPHIGGTVLRNVIEGKRDDETGKVVREYQSPIQPW